jgi:hypothetical protein
MSWQAWAGKLSSNDKWLMLNKQDVKVIRFVIFNFQLFD